MWLKGNHPNLIINKLKLSYQQMLSQRRPILNPNPNHCGIFFLESELLVVFFEETNVFRTTIHTFCTWIVCFWASTIWKAYEFSLYAVLKQRQERPLARREWLDVWVGLLLKVGNPPPAFLGPLGQEKNYFRGPISGEFFLGPLGPPGSEKKPGLSR